ncbi:MAG: GDP-mannose 4,6-dehydratase [Planctomycetota bacterium]
MSRILVTGGAGFIGSHLCEALIARGHDVVALDNFDEFYDPRRKLLNVAALNEHPRFSLVTADIRDADAVRKALPRAQIVVHLAARAGVRPSIEQPMLYHDVNVRGTLTLLEEVARIPGCKFIFGSSSSVYGNASKVPFSEDDPADAPISPYAATKRAGELLCHTYHHLHRMDLTCLRFFTVYGPRQRPDLAIHKFARLIDAGEPIPVFGDGSMSRDFTDVDDIVDGILRSMDWCAGYHIYNLGGSNPISVRDLIASLESALGKCAVIDPQPRQPGDVDRTFADLTRAQAELGFHPRTDLKTGLEKFVQWLRRDGGMEALKNVSPRTDIASDAAAKANVAAPRSAAGSSR